VESKSFFGQADAIQAEYGQVYNWDIAEDNNGPFLQVESSSTAKPI